LLDRIEWDNHIRCDYLLHGTGTGRLSSANPNVQNIPDESHIGFNIRTAFIPENDDWVLIESDYSQLELRIAAHQTGDKNLIKVYQNNGDLHKDVTDAAFKKKDITPYERSLAKSMVFGAVYDRGPESLAFGEEMDYIESELGGVRWTLSETKHFFNTFLSKYPELPKWQNEQRETAYKQRVLQTELGRFKRFPLITHGDNGTIGRQAINFPIQSLASDVTLDALIRIHSRLADLNYSVGKIVAHIVLTVHDSITTACHKKYVKRVKRIITEEMSSVPIETVVPFKVKIAIGKNWGDCK
jgi:DNA polymerase-1